MERFVIIVNGWKLLTIITKPSILDVAAVLDPPQLVTYTYTYLRIHMQTRFKEHVFMKITLFFYLKR